MINRHLTPSEYRSVAAKSISNISSCEKLQLVVFVGRTVGKRTPPTNVNLFNTKDQIPRNKPLLSYLLKDRLKNIEREFSSSYHLMGFPESSLKQLLIDLKLLQEDAVKLLWAGKKISRDHTQAAITWLLHLNQIWIWVMNSMVENRQPK